MPPLTPIVAVLDDEPKMRKALRRLLGAHGFCVAEFAQAGDFLAAYAEHPAACLVLDLQMPEVSGLKLLEVMAARCITLPVIVVTAHDEPDARQRAFDLGVSAYLTKPVNEAALLDALHAAGAHAT